MVALSVMGSAILLFSCERDEAEDAAASEETMRTEYSENLSIVESQNGRRSYHFVTPLVEGYSLAREPYREFRKGVKITTYKDDSLSTVDAVLTANYAIYYENRKLWEAKGNVVVVKSDGKNPTRLPAPGRGRRDLSLRRSPVKPPLHPSANPCPNPLSSPPSLRFRPGGPFARMRPADRRPQGSLPKPGPERNSSR